MSKYLEIDYVEKLDGWFSDTIVNAYMICGCDGESVWGVKAGKNVQFSKYTDALKGLLALAREGIVDDKGVEALSDDDFRRICGIT